MIERSIKTFAFIKFIRFKFYYCLSCTNNSHNLWIS